MRNLKLEPQNLRLELTNDEIKEFEKELENYKNNLILPKELSFYGNPFLNQEKFNGYVANDILGGVHWSIIHYCLKNQIIGKSKAGNWFVVAEFIPSFYVQSGTETAKTKAFEDFMFKWRALKKLKDMRLYAKDKENESFGIYRIQKIIKEGREKLNKI